MEYVQTVLVQIPADLIDEASRPQGLIAELDEHRTFLEQQPGFLDMRVTRSINAEGNVLVVVETRWQDDNSLVEYETREPTVMSIINKHKDLIIEDSLQVLDMEALRTGTGRTPATEATERLALPMLVPLGVLAFALLVIYGLSRIYLELDNDVATGLAAGIAVGILATAWFLVSRPSVPGWQVASIGVVAAAVLAGGALFAVIDDDDGEATAEEPSAAASPAAGETPAAPPAGTVLDVTMIPTIKFDTDRITIPADGEVTVRADNQDTAIFHNWAIYESRAVAESEGPSAAIALTEICAAPCTDEATFTAPPPGEYFFRCDVHPLQMVGTVIVE
jgi:plastocyanin/heme-degrading monooxygenase HmoA